MKQGTWFFRFAVSVAFGALLIVNAAATVRAGDMTVSAQPAVAPLVAMHSVYMGMVPQSRYMPLQHRPVEMPDLTGVSPATYAARKAAARYNRLAPYDARPIPDWYNPDARYTPGLLASFAGLSDSASTCPYFGGCQPPDMAVAASSSFVVQAVNTSVAIYSTSGAIKPGFPKDFTHFFHIPAPTPAGCDPAGPFASDPRAIYDPIHGKFWVAALQLEGALGLNSCNEKTIYWIAVSKTSDPTGGWNVYAFDMKFGTTNIADYTQIGLDDNAFYFNANMFDQFGSAYQYDEVFAADREAMEKGLPVTARGLKQIKLGGVLIDTLQPVLVEGPKTGPGLFVNAFNIFSGGGQCSSSCSGINVWAMKTPLTAPSLTVKTAASMSYSLPPLASQPGSPSSLETIDTRITGTPVYRGGIISWAHETAVSHGATTVPGIHWGQVKPTIVAGQITAVSMVQNAILSFTGDRAASFGAVMTDATGDLLMVFDSMSSTVFPGEYYASRLVTDPLGTLQAPQTLKKSVTSTFNSRWGDYEATSYDGAGDNIWFAAQYSATSGDWGTFIGEAKP